MKQHLTLPQQLQRAWPWVVGLLLLAGLLVLFRNRPETVVAVRPSEQELAEILALSGRVRGQQDSRLAPEVQGTLQRLRVREAQAVKAGQVLAELDARRLQAQLDQARQRVAVSRAQLGLAQRSPLASQMEETRSQVAAQQKAAQAQLESARQSYLEARRGPREELIDQARAGLQEATAEKEQREREWLRLKKLFSEDAIPLQQLEQAETSARRAQQQSAQARARLDELLHGSRPEQLARARQTWIAAQADWEAAQQAGNARIQQLLDLPRKEDIQLAEAQLAEAQSALRVAEEQLELSRIRAPFDGKVGRIFLRPGDSCGPNQPILSLSSQPALEIRIDLDESDRGRLQNGLMATIRAQGLSPEFQARLKDSAGEVDSVRGTLEVRLEPIDPPDWLLPGQTVDVNLMLSEKARRLVLPLSCVLLNGDRSEVFVLEQGVARRRSVQLSSPTQQGYLLLGGLEPREWVALSPQGLQDGQAVKLARP